MKKNVLSLSIQAMFSGFWDNHGYWMRAPAGVQIDYLIKVRWRIPPEPEETLDFRVFLSPLAPGATYAAI